MSLILFTTNIHWLSVGWICPLRSMKTLAELSRYIRKDLLDLCLESGVRVGWDTVWTCMDNPPVQCQWLCRSRARTLPKKGVGGGTTIKYVTKCHSPVGRTSIKVRPWDKSYVGEWVSYTNMSKITNLLVSAWEGGLVGKVKNTVSLSGEAQDRVVPFHPCSLLWQLSHWSELSLSIWN